MLSETAQHQVQRLLVFTPETMATAQARVTRKSRSHEDRWQNWVPQILNLGEAQKKE